MVCCMCEPSGGCCCGPCGIDEEVLLRKKQREKLLESIRKLKGLSRNSRPHVPLDPLAVMEEARTRADMHPATLCCLSKSGPGTCSMFLWLCVYGATLATLHFRLFDLGQVLPRMAMGILESEAFSDFHRFFPMGVLIMIAVMSAAFLLAALRICDFISSDHVVLCVELPDYKTGLCASAHSAQMTAEVVGAAQDELRLDVCESIDNDFYAFVRRLRDHFVTSEDFTVAAIRKAHRRLHSLLKARIALVDTDVHGPFVVRREVDTRVGPAQCCMLFFLFFVPWVVTICFNLVQLLVVYDTPVVPPADLTDNPQEVVMPPDVNTALNDEGLSIIAASVLINLIATLYLSFVQSRCVEQCFATCLFPRVHSAVVDYCNRLVCRTWEESVVDELVELLEEPRSGFDLNNSRDINVFQEVEEPPAFSAAALAPSQPPRLLTGDSCGTCPTVHQIALQAPSRAPRSKTRSQCLALEPFTMSPDTESCPGGLCGYDGHYFELDDLGIPAFDDSKAMSNGSECGERQPSELSQNLSSIDIKANTSENEGSTSAVPASVPTSMAGNRPSSPRQPLPRDEAKEPQG